MSQVWKALKAILGQYFREYDFILIGPKIGIVVIEVKSSKYTQGKDFSKKKKFLPDRYELGLRQLKSAEATLLPFLEECVGIKMQKLRVRKILVSPNLERHRFENWLQNLGSVDAERVSERIGDVIQLFKEDAVNSTEESEKPPFYTVVRKSIEASDFEIQPSVYESLGPVIAGLNSAKIMKGAFNGIEFEKLQFFEIENTLDVQ